MNADTFKEIYEEYVELLAGGDQQKAEQHMKDAIQRMSSEDRNKLMVELAAMTLEDEARERDVVIEMQEKTINTYNQLESTKEELEKENEDTGQ